MDHSIKIYRKVQIIMEVFKAPFIECILEGFVWFALENLRYTTYPEDMTIPDRLLLSKLGFFHSNMDIPNEPEVIICAYCSLHLEIRDKKNPSKGIVNAHLKKSPNCCVHDENEYRMSNIMGYITYLAHMSLSIRKTVKKHLFFLDIYYLPKHEGFIDANKRLETFTNCKVSFLEENKEKLANNGFFHVMGGIVKCFYCGGYLFNLKKNIDKLEYLHCYFYPNCQHILLNTGISTRNNAAVEYIRNNEKFMSMELFDIATEHISNDIFQRFNYTRQELPVPYINFDKIYNPLLKIDSEARSYVTSPEDEAPIIKNNKCLLCLSNSADIMVVPCNHVAYCQKCLINNNNRTCAVCRGNIYKVIKLIYCSS
ncbi:Apoptosis Inhibitor [Aratus pisonii nudivirus]|nr:Apoptosis Inhibitor [Aratus pisonii nudivirus]